MPDQMIAVNGDWTLVTSTSPSIFILQSCLPTATRVAGGWFDATTGAHWTQDPENASVIAHTAAGLELTPASTAFAGRAQVYQSFVAHEGAHYTATLEADQLSGSVQGLIFNGTNGSGPVEQASFSTPGQISFDFVATASIMRLYLRVDGTTGTARITQAAVDVAAGDQGLHRQSCPAPAGKLMVGRGSAAIAPAAGIVVDGHSGGPAAMTLGDLGPGTDGDHVWCRWDGPTGAQVFCSWRD